MMEIRLYESITNNKYQIRNRINVKHFFLTNFIKFKIISLNYFINNILGLRRKPRNGIFKYFYYINKIKIYFKFLNIYNHLYSLFTFLKISMFSFKFNIIFT